MLLSIALDFVLRTGACAIISSLTLLRFEEGSETAALGSSFSFLVAPSRSGMALRRYREGPREMRSPNVLKENGSGIEADLALLAVVSARQWLP